MRVLEEGKAMLPPDETDRVSLGDLIQAKNVEDVEQLNVVDAPDIKPKRKPKPKPVTYSPLPQTRGQWLMIGVMAACVFVLAGIFFWVFPTRTVEIYVTPTQPPIQTYAPPPDPLYQVNQKVQVFNLTPDVAGYQDWWVSRPQWLPNEGVWIYEVRTYDGITLMRAENQLAPIPPATTTPVP